MRLPSRSLLVSFLFCVTPRVYSRDEHAEFHTYHRVIHPNLPVTPWADLGTVIVPHLSSISPLGTPATFFPSVSLVDDLSEFAENVDPALEESLYQITIERPGMREEGWPISVMKGCLMPISTSSSITIHLSPSGEPFALDYFVSPVSSNGPCLPPSETRRIYPQHNTTVVLKSPRSPPSPGLRTPPPLTPDGVPIQPVPEKSFIQKYWIYIAIALAAFLITTPPEESAGSRNGPRPAR